MSSSYNLLLIDSRIPDFGTILQSLNAETIGVVFHYETDTYGSIIDKIRDALVSVTTLHTVHTLGILQHNYYSPFYQLVASEPECLLGNVSVSDPALERWQAFKDFITTIITQYGLSTLDLLACAIYADDNWKYVVDNLKTTLQINVRASLDDTGSASAGGNWILESSDNVNVKSVYFTDEIDAWNYTASFRFTGWGDRKNYISLGLPSARTGFNTITSALTIECWFKTSTAPSGIGPLISRYNSDANGSWRLIINSNGRIEFRVGLSSGENISQTSSSYTDGVWHYVAAVYASSTMYIYVDGVLNVTTTTGGGNIKTASSDNDYKVIIGSEHSLLSDRFFTGYIEEVRLWNVDRRSSIALSYARRLTSGEALSTVGYWKLLDSVGNATDYGPYGYNGIVDESQSIAGNLAAYYTFDSTAIDSSSSNKHLSNNGGVTYSTSDYKRGTASASFNGSNYFEVANDGSFSPDNITIMCWVKPNNTNNTDYQTIASCRSTNSGWMIYITPYVAGGGGNNIEFWTGNGGGAWSGGGISIYGGFGSLTSWVHLAFTLNKSTTYLTYYINGVAQASVVRNYTNNNGTSLRIGAGSNESSAKYYINSGTLIDDFRIYNKILTTNEIVGAISSWVSADYTPSDTIVTATLTASVSTSVRNIVDTGSYAINGNFTSNVSSYVVYTVPTNNFCTISTDGTVTLKGNAANGGSVVVTATVTSNGIISNTVTATHTIYFLRTPVYNNSAVGVDKYYVDIGTSYNTSSFAPTATSFTPNLVSPTYTYGVAYLSNQEYASVSAQTATTQSSSSSTYNIVGTGQCYLTVTAARNLTSFLESVTVSYAFLTVHPGYIVGPNVDLTGAVIQNYNLSGVNFTSANLTNARIVNCLLANATFTSANLTGGTFIYNTMDNTTNLTGTNFTSLTSNNNTGTTTQISSSWKIQSGQIVESGTVIFSLRFTLASPSATIPTNNPGLVTTTPYAGDGHYRITEGNLLINGKIESAIDASMSSNFIVKNTGTRYLLTQVGPGSSYLFELINSSNVMYIRGIVNNAVVALPNVSTRQEFAASFKVQNLISPYVVKGSYIFGPQLDLSGTYFDDTITPKPDLTDLTFSQLKLSGAGITTIRGWNFTRTKLYSGTFSSVNFYDCNCNSTDFSGSNLRDSTFQITYTSENAAIPNIATLNGAKFTNCGSISGLTIAGYDNGSTELNQMNVSNLDFSGSPISSIKTYFLNKTGAGPVRMTSQTINGIAYSYSMLTDSLIGRFMAGPGISLNGLTLGNASFNGVNLSNLDISAANLSSASLAGISLRTGNLTYSSTTVLPSGFRIAKPKITEFTNPAFITGPNVDLSGVNAIGTNFELSNVTGMNFTNANFSGVTSGSIVVNAGQSQPTLPSAYYSLVGGYFIGPFVDLSGAYLGNATLTNANLTGVNLTNSTLAGVKSGGITTTAIIGGTTYTTFPTFPTGYSLTRGYIVGPDMDFTNADLSGFDFTNVNLSGTKFTGANLTYVVSGNTNSSPSTTLDPSYTFLSGFIIGPKVNLSSKNLSGVKFSTVASGGFSLSGSLFVSANFTGADISGIIIDDIDFRNATFQNVRSRNIPQPLVPPTFTAGSSAGYVIRNGYLIGANVDMSFTDLSGMDISNTVLTGVNLTGATLTNVKSGGVSVLSTSQPSLPPKFKVVGGYLHGPSVDLSGANLTSLDFSTQANAINWSSANLTNAVFIGMKSGWIEIDSDVSGPVLSDPYVYNRRVATNPSGGFIIGPGVNLSSANFTNFDLRNVLDVSNVNFTNATFTNVKTSGSIATPTAGNFPTFSEGSGYVLYRGFIIGPSVDMSGTDVSGFVFGTSAAATTAGSTSALSGVNFTNANLTTTNLFGSTVNGTIFTGANFLRTRTGGLSYTTAIPAMPDATTYKYISTTSSGGYIIGPGVDLTQTNLQGANFTGVNFKNVTMTDANISNTSSESVTFDASSALPANYTFVTNSANSSFIMGPNLDFTSKTLNGAAIRNVDLTNTIFTNASLIGVKSSGITFTTGSSPVFTVGSGYTINAGFLVGPSVDLSGESMMGVDFSGQNLTSVVFVNADLSGANLYETNLSYATFSGASFINIKSGGRISFVSQPTLPSSSYKLVANGYNERIPGSGFQRYIVGPSANCRGADFSGALFDRVDLSGVDFSGANFTNVASGIMRNVPILSSLPTGFGLVSGISTQAIESQDPSYNNALYFVGPYANLGGAFLKNATLQNLDVTGANFIGADFNGIASSGLINSAVNPATLPSASYFIRSGYIFGPTVNLSGGIFTGLDLSNSILTGANLQNADFTNANIINCNILNANLAGSTMNGAKTSQITYQGYDYGSTPGGQDPTMPTSYRYVYSSAAETGYIIGPYVDISGANLTGANLSYSNMTGVNLYNASLTNARSGNITLSGGVQPTFTPGAGYKILSGYIVGPYVDLTGVDFTNQDFSGTNLTGTNFRNSIFVNIKSGNIVASPVLPTFPDTTYTLRYGYIFGPSVDLSFTDLSGMDISGITITNARMQNTNFFNVRSGGIKGTTAFFRPNYMIRNGYIIGDGVDLSGATLTAQNLSTAVFTNVNLTNVTFSNATLLARAKSGGNLRYNARTLSTMPTGYTIRGTYIVGPRVDLSGANLANLDLSNTILTGADMTNAAFTNMRSGGIQMLTSGPITFSSGSFYGSEYGYKFVNGYIVGPGVDLTNSDFTGVTFSAVDLSGAIMTGSTLASIRSVNVAGIPASLPPGYKVTARYIIGPGLDMSGYNFTNGDFSGANISGSNLVNANFTNTSSGNVTGSALTRFTTTTEPVNIKYQLSNGYIVGPKVNLSNGDLSGVSIAGINLTGAVLYNTKSGRLAAYNDQTVTPSSNYSIVANYIIGPDVNLTGVDFSGVDLRYTNLTNVNFAGANLYNVKSGFISGTPQQLPTFYSFIGGYIIGPSTDLSGADLSGGNLAGASIQDADLTNANFYNVSSGGVQGTPRNPLNAPYVVTPNGYIVGPNVNLNNATMTDIDLRGLTITNAIMTNMNFTNTKTGNTTGPPRALSPPYIYVETTLSGGFIVGPYVDISYGNFSYASIATADLTGAKLSNAVFYRTRSGNMAGSGIPASLPSGYRVLSTTASGGYLVGPNVDLNDANFSGSGTTLSGLNITNAVMERVRFDGALAGGGQLIGPPSTLTALYRFIQSSVSGGYIIGPSVDLEGANFTNTDISGVYVDGIKFTNVNFTNTKSGRLQVRAPGSGTPASPILPTVFSPTTYRLIFSTLSGGYIVGPNVNLSDANFTSTDISNTFLTGVNMSGATLTNMRSGLLTANSTSYPSLPPNYKYIATSASGGYIIGPSQNLRGANLTGADLSFCNFYGCDISQALFPTAPESLRYVRSGGMPNANPPGTLPHPYKFVTNDASGAYIVGPYVDLSGANLEASILTNTDISSADFTNARLRYIRSGGMPNTNPPSALPPPYKFVTSNASGGFIIGPYVDLSGANLESSILTNTDISSVNFTNVRLKYVRSGGMPNTHPPATLPPPYKFVTNDASGAYIVGPYVDLSGANLEASVLTNTDISSADFTNARLKYARSGGMPNTHPPAALPPPYKFITNEVSGAYIVGPYSDLSGANLEASILTNTDISSADFTNARLKYARSGGMPNAHPPAALPSPYKFITNDASGAYIVGPYSDLSGANLEASVLTNADISSADFTNARLKYARSGGMPNTHPPATLPPPYKFITNDASGAYIVGPYSDLSGANLEASILTNTDISSADFTNAQLKYVRSGGMPNAHPPAVLPSPYKFITNDASGAYIVGPFADLSGANLESSTLTNTDISSANFTNARLRNVKTGLLNLNGAFGAPSALPAKYAFVRSAVTASGGYIIGPGVDLTSAVLTGTDLSGIVFTDTNVENARLANTTLVNVRSGGIQGTPATFASGYTLVNGAVNGGNTSGAYIVGARVDLSGANLSTCVLSGLDVSGANMFGANLLNAVTGPNLVGPPAVFPSASYNYVVSSASGGFIIGPGVNISGANLTGSNLTNYDFRGADLTGVDLTGCILTNVKSGLTTGPPKGLPPLYTFMTDNSFGAFIVGPNVDLSGANLTNCRFTGLNITGASFTNATLVNVKSGGGMMGPPASLPSTYRYVYDGPAGDNTAGYFIGPGVDLSGARLRNLNVDGNTTYNLDTAYFTNANITNANFSGSVMKNVKSGGMVGAPQALPANFAHVVSASGGYFIGPESDLRNANLNDVVLTGMNIYLADMSGVTFVNTLTGRLTGPPRTLSTGYYFIDQTVTGGVVDGYILGPRINLSGANLAGANLTDYDLSGTNLSNGVFTNTNLTNTNIYNSNLTGINPGTPIENNFTVRQNLQLLKNRNNRSIARIRTTDCLAGDIDVVAATSPTPYDPTYNRIYDHVRGVPTSVLIIDGSGNSNLSNFNGRIFYIPSGPGESFYVDASATIFPLPPAQSPSSSSTVSLTQYYHDVARAQIIETATGNTIRSILVKGKIFMVFEASMLGISVTDVYRAMGFPAVYDVYSYYGTRNLMLPEKVSRVNVVTGNGTVSLNWTPSFADGKPRTGYYIQYVDQAPVARLYIPWVVYSEQYPLTNVTIPGLRNGTVYYFRVAALNVVGKGEYSDVVTCIPGTRPDAVTTLFIANGSSLSPSQQQFVLEWLVPYSQGYAVQSYTIRYSAVQSPLTPPTTDATVISVNANDPALVSTLQGTTTILSYTVTITPTPGASPGQLYQFQISSTNELGTSDLAYPTPVTNTTLPDPDAMTVLPPSIVYARIGDVPLQVNVSSIIPTIIPDSGGKKAKLSWLVPTPYTYVPYAYAIKYVLLEPADGNPSSPLPSPASIPDASWNILPASSYTTVPDTARTAAEGGANVGVMTIVSGLTNGKSYSFKVAAINAVGRGAYSNSLPVAVMPGSVPSVLTVTTEFAYTINTATGGNVTLYWTVPNKNGYAITTYRVRRRANPSDAWTTVEIAIPPGVTDTYSYRTLTITSLVNGNAYEFQISSRNALGWSEFSDTLYATPRKVPDPIMAVTVSALNQGLRVNWSTAGVSDGGYPVTGYRVQYLPVTPSTPSDAWQSKDIDGIYNSTTDINALVNGITHRIRVLQFNAIGSSVPETSAVVTGVPGVVALAPISLFISLGNARVTVYWVPPPSSGTNDIAYYYVQYKVASAPDSAYQYVMNGNVPKQYTEASLIPNPPGYDSFVARVEGLTNGTQYSVRVSAVTQVGIGAWSDPVQGIPGTVPSKVV